ncbi:2-amino-4-hydroxy-6-hydroxymethyldihydropteridine diphosphokinase [Novipirellula artificiosorum]|uniref:2-amino-4-hydroxy-6-hydroxymethyldihydropteridine pyrophosphokinase n=1 Tax=Novipirellula artificiosorum TaxID=2528016 RepID=A0A5C6DRG8_9BACT|nr:2-amino-4-hydroxy-6-hydroxymethyldihydropteridine diphosphokinase [Novipirellula artificiosorum]TWU38457.1 2-amino-4-hydroxy-6-hydroxymethyldihydropteridine pyrophosphokinase [Novipirellula artificiosorum]
MVEREHEPPSQNNKLAQCLVSFGSNLGDRDRVIAEAARRVARSPIVKSFTASRLFETPPIGGPEGQEPFLNAVAAIDTAHSAREILGLLQGIEHDLGRQRRKRWDARSIDLDVVMHGQLVGAATALIVPHPRYTARQFVLQPACDVAEHYRDPRFGWTIRQLTTHLSAGSASMSLIGGDESTRQNLCKRLENDHGIRTFAAEIDLSGLSESLPWISQTVPALPIDCPDRSTFAANLPRLIARMQWSTPATRWPAPHQIWPTGTRWPEYRLEIDDLAWAASEIASALDSMRCPVRPVTTDGKWYFD